MATIYVCIHTRCDGHKDPLEAILHGQHHLADGQAAIRADLAAIKRELGIVKTEQENFMSDFDTKVAAINASLDTLSADDQRVLADLQALKDSQGTLTPDQDAQLDALLAKVQGEDAAVNAADPAPVVTPPTDGGDTPVDGSGDGTTPTDGSGDGSTDTPVDGTPASE